MRFDAYPETDENAIHVEAGFSPPVPAEAGTHMNLFWLFSELTIIIS